MARRPAPPLVVLEVAPRCAKSLAAVASPFGVQQVHAFTAPAETEDPTAALRGLLEARPLPAKALGVLFGREFFSLRTLELPSVDPKEIASMLELQLGKLTPYPRADILFGWAVIGSLREGYTSVLLAVARKVPIERALQLLKTRGLTPTWAGVSTEGLEAWAGTMRGRLPLGEGQLAVIIDIDFASTDCAILDATGRLLFTHSLGIGREQLASSDQAALKFVGELIRLPRILLHEEIKGKIERGLVIGPPGAVGAIVEQLASQWGATVDTADPLELVATPEVRERARATPVSYTALLGIAAANRRLKIDLVPQETRVSQALHVRSRHLAQLAGSLAAILILVVLLLLERVLVLQHHLWKVRTQAASVEQDARQVLARQEQMRVVRGWLNPSQGALELFRSLAAAADESITITQVTMEDGKPVVIRGRTGTIASAFAFADRLKSGGAFQAVNARPALRPKGTNELGAEFEVSCEWKGASG